MFKRTQNYKEWRDKNDENPFRSRRGHGRLTEIVFEESDLKTALIDIARHPKTAGEAATGVSNKKHIRNILTVAAVTAILSAGVTTGLSNIGFGIVAVAAGISMAAVGLAVIDRLFTKRKRAIENFVKNAEHIEKVNESISQGKALVEAVKRQNYDDVLKALENGAEVNTQDGKGNTALMIAAMHNNVMIATLLLKEPKLDLKIRNSHGQNAETVAEIFHSKVILTMIRMHAEKELQSSKL